MMKKRILLTVPSLRMGGMERVLVTYANLFSEQGYDVTVMNYSSDDPDIVSLLSPSVRYLKNYRPVPNLKQASLRDLIKGNFRIIPFDVWLRRKKPSVLHRKMIKEKYDMEAAFFGAELIRTISGCTDSRTKKVCWIHNENLNGIFQVITSEKERKKIFSQYDDVICVSGKVAENMKRELPWYQEIHTLYNPIDSSHIRRMACETDGVPPKEKMTFIMVCRLSINPKGIDRMVKCAAELQKDYKFEIWIVGDGADRERVLRLIQDYKVSCIRLMGQQSNPYKFMKRADMYLCTSRVEGFSISMSEAVSLGLPILTTDVSGAQEMLGDSEYGYIVENSDDGIYKGMKRFLDDLKLLIDAFSVVYERHPDYTMRLYGDGSQRDVLLNYIRERALDECVFIEPFQQNIHMLVRDAAMYVSSSDWEGMSNAMLEALAIGLPCVCTDCPIGGTREIIQQGVSGLLVSVGNVNELAVAILSVIEDDSLAAKLSRNGLKIRETLDAGRIAKLWLEAAGRV